MPHTLRHHGCDLRLSAVDFWIPDGELAKFKPLLSDPSRGTRRPACPSRPSRPSPSHRCGSMHLRVSYARAVADRFGQAPGVYRSRMRDDRDFCHLELSFHWSPSRLRSDVVAFNTAHRQHNGRYSPCKGGAWIFAVGGRHVAAIANLVANRSGWARTFQV
jgi:hypothetical protein